MKAFLLFLLLLCYNFSFAQNKAITETVERTKSIKPLRVGAQFGFPSLASGFVEYVSPLLDNRVGLKVNYGTFSQTVDDVSIKYSNFEIGPTIYLSNSGKGLYASATYFSFNSDGTFESTDFDDGTSGDATAQIKFNTLNFKVGAKLGRVFYFLIEVGYGFGKIPENVTVQSIDSNSGTEVEFPEIPGVSNSGAVIVNIGIGFGFL